MRLVKILALPTHDTMRLTSELPRPGHCLHIRYFEDARARASLVTADRLTVTIGYGILRRAPGTAANRLQLYLRFFWPSSRTKISSHPQNSNGSADLREASIREPILIRGLSTSTSERNLIRVALRSLTHLANPPALIRGMISNKLFAKLSCAGNWFGTACKCPPQKKYAAL